MDTTSSMSSLPQTDQSSADHQLSTVESNSSDNQKQLGQPLKKRKISDTDINANESSANASESVKDEDKNESVENPSKRVKTDVQEESENTEADSTNVDTNENSSNQDASSTADQDFDEPQSLSASIAAQEVNQPSNLDDSMTSSTQGDYQLTGNETVLHSPYSGEKLILKPGQTLKYLGKRKVCSNCKVTKTPVWRKGPLGTGSLCNACGLKWASGTIVLDPITGSAPGVPLDRTMIRVVNESEEDTAEPARRRPRKEKKSPSSEKKKSKSKAKNPKSRPGDSGKNQVFNYQFHNNAYKQMSNASSSSSSGVPLLPHKKRIRNKQSYIPSTTSAQIYVPFGLTPEQAIQKAKEAGQIPNDIGDSDILVENIEDTSGKFSKIIHIVKKDEKSRSTPKKKGYDKGGMMDISDDEVTESSSDENSKDGSVVSRRSHRTIRTPNRFRDFDSINGGNDSNVYGGVSIEELQKRNNGMIEANGDMYDINKTRTYSSYSSALMKKRLIKNELSEAFVTFGNTYDVPQIVLERICIFLDPISLKSCMKVSSVWYDCARNNTLWKYMYSLTWRVQESNLKTYKSYINWYKLYQARLHINKLTEMEQTEYMCKFYVVENNPKILECIINKTEQELLQWVKGNKGEDKMITN